MTTTTRGAVCVGSAGDDRGQAKEEATAKQAFESVAQEQY
jgi:hypothetical protein